MTTKTLNDLIGPALAHPDMLQVTRERTGAITVFKVSVHGADYGRLCGKGGRNLGALNAIIEPIAKDCRVVLAAALTSDRFEHVPRNPFWHPAPVLAMLRTWQAAAGIPGSVEMSEHSRDNGTYDLFFTERLPADLLNPLAKWGSVVAQSLGGKICLQGAHYAAA